MRPAGTSGLPYDPFARARERGDDKVALRTALSELEAARARVERDRARVLDETRRDLLVELLPVLDNLDRSIAADPDDDDRTRGVAQIRAQLEGVLRGYGMERFDAAGDRFDPRVHEAIAVVEVDDPDDDGVVAEQVQAGYRIGDRLLRAALVRVGRCRTSRSR